MVREEVVLVDNFGVDHGQVTEFGRVVTDQRPKLSDHLHVLLRHRLLRQPGGFEGFAPVSEGNVSSRESVHDRDQVRVFERHLDPVPTPSMEAVEGEHPIVADRLDALDLDAKGLPRLPERVPELSPPLSPSIDGLGIGEELRCC